QPRLPCSLFERVARTRFGGKRRVTQHLAPGVRIGRSDPPGVSSKLVSTLELVVEAVDLAWERFDAQAGRVNLLFDIVGNGFVAEVVRVDRIVAGFVPI